MHSDRDGHEMKYDSKVVTNQAASYFAKSWSGPFWPEVVKARNGHRCFGDEAGDPEVEREALKCLCSALPQLWSVSFLPHQLLESETDQRKQRGQLGKGRLS